MQKRKKHPKLPNGFGSIRFLKGNRRNPYCVQPPSQGLDINGCPVRPKPLCYVDNWYKGLAVLTAYNAGTYAPGMEHNISFDDTEQLSVDSAIRKMLSNYALITQRIAGVASEKLSFAEIYEKAYNDKFNTGKTYSQSLKGKLNAAYKKCGALYSKPFEDIRYIDLQTIIDTCPLKRGSLEDLIILFRMMYKYAIKMDLVVTDYSQHLSIKDARENEHGVPFSDEELALLWQDVKNPIAELLLIMCYSGHRISEYIVMEVNLKEAYFKGGVKNKTSRERVVPIHSAIYPLVKRRLRRCKHIIENDGVQRAEIEAYCKAHGMNHTPHDTRHTFSRLCEKYGVAENDRKRMLGHAFSDVTNAVYGHRTLEDLRGEIEKIQTINI